MKHHLRIARPVRDLALTSAMYCAGLGLRVVGSFENHEGFDGVMLGRAGMDYHFEFTYCRTHPVAPQWTAEDLVVFYLADKAEWLQACSTMESAGFKRVTSFNPYWDMHGATFEDPDGYRTVLQNAAWNNAEAGVGT